MPEWPSASAFVRDIFIYLVFSITVVPLGENALPPAAMKALQVRGYPAYLPICADNIQHQHYVKSVSFIRVYLQVSFTGAHLLFHCKYASLASPFPQKLVSPNLKGVSVGKVKV